MAEETASRANEPEQPFLRVIRGDASPEEVAAIVAVLASLQAEAAAAARRRPEWNHYRRGHRTTFRRGPGGWRASALPG